MDKEIYNTCIGCGHLARSLTCLKKYGKLPLKYGFDIPTYHNGQCDCCGKKTAVTETRVFFYPDFSLIEKVKKFLEVDNG